MSWCADLQAKDGGGEVLSAAEDMHERKIEGLQVQNRRRLRSR